MDKNKFHDKNPKVLKMAKKSFLFTCDVFNNIQKAPVFFLCTPMLNMQVNQLKHFIYRINFLFSQKTSKK